MDNLIYRYTNILNSLFAGVTKGTGAKDVTDRDVITISKKITTLEMKELNERQRAEHANRMYEQQRSILHDLETRNKELEEKFSEVCIKYLCCQINCYVSLNIEM